MLIIVDGSVAVTGALVSAARQAALLKDKVRTVLALPRGHRVPASRLVDFAGVIELSIVPLRKSVGSLLAYGPALITSTLQLRREMRRRGCDRVQLNDFYFLQGAILRLLGFRGRIVSFVRIDPTRFGFAGRIWLAATRRSSDEIVAVSKFIQSMLGPDQPSRLIYGQSTITDRIVDGRPSATMTFLFVGNYIAGKGQEHAVAAFHRIAPRYPAARLRFVGGDMGLTKNGQFRARLEQAGAAGPGAERIEFCGSRDDLRGDYAEAFAALNFSASESFSNTCLDASSAGLPVIATRCGGPEEIVEDGQTGWLVPVGDIDAMAERMAWLLDHAGKAAAMGGAGSALVTQRFAPARAARELSAALGL